MTNDILSCEEALESLGEHDQVYARVELNFADALPMDPATFRKLLKARDDNETRAIVCEWLGQKLATPGFLPREQELHLGEVSLNGLEVKL